MNPDACGLEPPPLKALFGRHGRAMLWTAVATVGVGCGTLTLGLHGGLEPSRAGVLTLMAVTAWILLAAAPLAASADDWLGALCRGSILADASIITLICLHAWGGGRIGWIEGVQIYLLWAGLAVAAALAVRLGRRRARFAAVAVCLGALGAGSLFWSAGLLDALGEPTRRRACQMLLIVNPLAAVVDAAADPAFIWHEQPVMYGVTRMGQDFPPPPYAWWMSAAVAWTIAALLTGWLTLREFYRRWRYGT